MVLCWLRPASGYTEYTNAYHVQMELDTLTRMAFGVYFCIAEEIKLINQLYSGINNSIQFIH